MLFLFLALLFSAVLALVLKYLNTGSPYGVYFVNYITCALLATLVLLIREGRPLTKRDVFFGILAGVPNFLSSRLLLAALAELPAFLVYPSYSVGVILVISIASYFLFRERLNGRQMGAAGMILGALVLLNL